MKINSVSVLILIMVLSLSFVVTGINDHAMQDIEVMATTSDNLVFNGISYLSKNIAIFINSEITKFSIGG